MNQKETTYSGEVIPSQEQGLSVGSRVRGGLRRVADTWDDLSLILGTGIAGVGLVIGSSVVVVGGAATAGWSWLSKRFVNPIIGPKKQESRSMA